MKRPKNIMDTEPPHAPMPATEATALRENMSEPTVQRLADHA